MRDLPVAIRTSLTIERTVLAYLWNGVALFIGAATARELLEDLTRRSVGAVLAVFGSVTLTFGFWRFGRMPKEVNTLRDA